MKNPQNIIITGASSGLGAALAAHYAAAGISLYLLGRNETHLENVANLCRAKGANAHTKILDVTDAQGMGLYLSSLRDIDLIVANAGISAGSGTLGEGTDQIRKIFATNIDGVVNSIQPVVSGMVARKRGQIAIVSSLAGIRGLPSCPAYSASKACVRYWGEGLRGVLGKHGVKVSVVCPGYIRTPMTDVNDFPMPLLMSPQKAARIIANGLAKNRSRIAFPRRLYWPIWWLMCLSPALTDWFFARLPAKPSGV